MEHDEKKNHTEWNRINTAKGKARVNVRESIRRKKFISVLNANQRQKERKKCNHKTFMEKVSSHVLTENGEKQSAMLSTAMEKAVTTSILLENFLGAIVSLFTHNRQIPIHSKECAIIYSRNKKHTNLTNSSRKLQFFRCFRFVATSDGNAGIQLHLMQNVPVQPLVRYQIFQNSSNKLK